MIQNIKVDLIYYATPSDFEMEFNLNGCCRMRLLTDKVQDRRGLVSSLAKAVSRSKVIITCGNLFGGEGVIATVAAAIGKTVTAADNKTYGINSDDEIGIIDGSVPLVTADGIFGGCIIECGPQTIIALTESKSVKKALLKELIHPYISELSVLPETAVRPAEATAPAKEPEEVEALEEAEATEEEETAEEVVAETTEEAEEIAEVIEKAEETAQETEEAVPMEDIPFITEIEEAEETAETPIIDDSFNAMHIEAKAPKRDAKSYYEYFVPSSEEDIFIAEEEEFDNLKPTSSKLNAPIIIIAILLVLMLAVIGYFLLFIPLTSGQDIGAYINELFSVSENMLV
ncbi:MAG: hypothetical protein IJZ75_01385 [Clostridia bacterium]|nr:hypothetical protein [Clostridia bacterium]